MGRYRFIASRLRFKGKLPLVCIAVSFVVMICAVSISSGFRREIRAGIAAVSGDIQLLPLNSDMVSGSSPVGRSPAYLSRLDSLPGVDRIVPAVYRVGIVKSGENIHGVIFKGIPRDSGSDSLALGVSVPRRLADMLTLKVGDRLPAYFVSDRVKARNFTVRDIYEGIIDTDDKLIVYASIEDMQRLNSWDSTQVSALEIFLRESWRNDTGMKAVEDEAGFIAHAWCGEDDVPVYAKSALSSYPQLFDWLNLIDFNVLFILVLMTVVAGFNMISGLLIMLFRNISTIGLLKSLGMKDRDISKVFLLSSSSFVLKGMAIGNVLAIAFCLLADRFRLIPLDPVNYFVDHVPAALNFPLILLADLCSYLLIMLLLLIPCHFISKVDPADTVRVR